MRILAIETSCDDTGVALLEINAKNQSRLLADLVSSQIKIHAPWGGVVPMLAKREHQRNLLPLLKQTLKENKLLKISKFPASPAGGQFPNSKFTPLDNLKSNRAIIPEPKSQIQNTKYKILNTILEREPELLKNLSPFLKKYQKPDIDSIAVTIGPGLEPALWVGVNFARALAYFWDLPVMAVNHVEAHISANFIENKVGADSKKIFPAVCLVVSGGHTQLILIKKFGSYQILGETRDDAAGEAFDKVAKMLNLGYPGGPIISRLAEKFNSQIPNPKSQINTEYKIQIQLPRPMINSNDFDFSFSGLKTAALYLIKKLTNAQIKKLTPAICAEFQQVVVDVLTTKTIRAAKKYNAKTIMLSGGVAANDLLRETLKHETEKLKTDKLTPNFFVPPKNLCTDNAVMIAYAACLNLKNKKRPRHNNWQNLKAQANLRIK